MRLCQYRRAAPVHTRAGVRMSSRRPAPLATRAAPDASRLAVVLAAGARRQAAPTDEFMALKLSDAARLNKEHGNEPITYEPYKAEMDEDSSDPTFRVKKQNGSGWNYYDGRSLYNALKMQPKGGRIDPKRNMVKEEEYQLLKDRFERSTEYNRYSWFVEDRLKNNHHAWKLRHYEGSDPYLRRIAEIVYDDRTEFYAGKRGEERKVREEYNDGPVFFYEGEQGKEELVRTEKTTGRTKKVVLLATNPRGIRKIQYLMQGEEDDDEYPTEVQDFRYSVVKKTYEPYRSIKTTYKYVDGKRTLDTVEEYVITVKRDNDTTEELYKTNYYNNDGNLERVVYTDVEPKA